MSRWAVFVSGEGSNLQNFLDLEADLKNQKIAVVFADRDCRGIERAKEAGKPTMILSPKSPGWNASVLDFLKTHHVDSIFLLGYMRILSPEFLKAWEGALINLHPSWLPKYPGVEAVKRAFDAGEKFFGVTLHLVVEDVDAGQILRQISFPRDPKFSFDDVMKEVRRYEHKLVRDYLLDLDRI
jgi:phosphoribosylglycinamide formyltransferase-1